MCIKDMALYKCMYLSIFYSAVLCDSLLTVLLCRPTHCVKSMCLLLFINNKALKGTQSSDTNQGKSRTRHRPFSMYTDLRGKERRFALKPALRRQYLKPEDSLRR